MIVPRRHGLPLFAHATSPDELEDGAEEWGVRKAMLPALKTAPRCAAEMLDEQAVFGTIEPGKRADLLVLAANPLDDIRNTRTFELVVLDRVWKPPRTS